MASTPQATVTISADASAAAGGSGYCAVIATVPKNADVTPRVFGSWKGIYELHGYAPGASYAALHTERTRQPVLFIGVPIDTPGALGRVNASGVDGTSIITVSDGPDGYLEETDCIVRVLSGGTVGSSNIRIEFSADGGRTRKPIRLGTATSYTVPYLGIVLNFGGGTLVTGDEYTFSTTAPKPASDAVTAARVALAATQKRTRTWVLGWDIATRTEATQVTTAVNAYETANKRFVRARVNVRDRLPQAEMSRATVRMSGSPTLTFAEVGETGDTITRSTGSFIADGFVSGMMVTVTGSSSNNISHALVTNVAETVLTLDDTDLEAEGPVGGCTIIGSHGLTFAEVGETGDTITRSGGSWLADGFRVGDKITVKNTSSNNITDAVIATVTASVITLDDDDLANEAISSHVVTITAGETMAQWVSDQDSEFTNIDGQNRISLGLGRLRTICPITGWAFRRPVSWAASIREYQHDVHRTTWYKGDGPLVDWSAEDENGNLVEFDQDLHGGGLEGRFTCARTWRNGPNGPFIAMDLTRAEEGSLLSYTHNMDVANVTCSIVQATTENMIGGTPTLKSDGTLTSAARQLLEEAVNSELEQALLREHVPGEGPRASGARWVASETDVLNVVNATLTGMAELRVNGTIVNVATLVRVR